MKMELKWSLGEPECELVFQIGEIYPTHVICTLYERNVLGEKRFVEQKTFKLVEVKNEESQMENIKRPL